MTRLTLSEFLEQLPALSQAFAEATRRHGMTDTSFLKSRTLDDWFREMEAWTVVVELDEASKQPGATRYIDPDA